MQNSKDKTGTVHQPEDSKVKILSKEEEILIKIIKKIGEERREEIEKRITQLIGENPRLTRLGALYLIGEELGVFEASRAEEYVVPLGKLVGGLNNVNVVCRVLGMSGPLKSGSTEYAYMRLGDNTGVVSAIVWSEPLRKMADMNILVGDVLFIKEAYTKEGVDGKTELHLGKNAIIKKIEDADIQPLEAFFKEELPTEKRGFELDVKAKIIGLSDEFAIDLKRETTTLREALLLMGKRILGMTAWREHVNLLKSLMPGQIVLISGAKYVKRSLSITPKTCIVPIDATTDLSLPELKITILDIVGSKDSDNIYIIACSDYVLFAKHPNLELGKSYLVKKYELIYEDRKWLLVPFELGEKLDADVQNLQTTYTLRELSEDLSYVCVEGRVGIKTPLATQKSKSGEEIETLNFWLSDGERNIYSRVFGKNAAVLNNIPEGSKVRLKWIKVRKTRFGSLEVILDDVSKVERLKED